VIRVALLTLAIWVPGTLYPPSDVSHFSFRVAVCLAACGTVAIPQGRLVRAGLALWGAGIAWSVVAAPDPWRALWSTHSRNEGAWQAAHYLLLVLVASFVARASLARWVALAALAAAAWGVAPLGWVDGRLAGSTGNPLYLAPLLLIGAWGAWRAGWRWLAALLVVAALATGSKGVVVALVAAGGVWLLARAPGRVILAVGAVVAAGVWFAPMPDSGAIRIELGRIAVAGIAERPLGWGAEGFSFAFDRFWTGFSPTGEVWHDRVHCHLLDRAIEWGVVGVAGWIAVVVAAWRRAELPERMAIAAYLGFGLTMFPMMWGEAAFAALLGYTLRGRPCRVDRRVAWTAAAVAAPGRVFSSDRGSRIVNKPFALLAVAVALGVGAAQLNQSHAAARAADMPSMERAIDLWSPVGGDVVVLYLKAPQTAATLEWAADRVELWAPHASRQAMLLALWDRKLYCADLRATAPRRPDTIALCGGRDE
jgi:hypothetical protein